MVVDDFNLVSVSLSPHEADTPLIVDPNAMLAFSIPVKSFEPIPGWRREITKLGCGVQLTKFAQRHSFDGPKSPHPLPTVEALRVLAAKAPNHHLSV